MAEQISVNNQPFSSSDLELLNVLAAHVIPADDQRNMPSGSAVGFVSALIENASHIIPTLQDELALIESSSDGGSFVKLSSADQKTLLADLREKHPGLLNRFAVHLATCYFQDPRVLANIGLEARAPFPKGFTDQIKRGDLSLLDPVRDRGPIWRPAD